MRSVVSSRGHDTTPLYNRRRAEPSFIKEYSRLPRPEELLLEVSRIKAVILTPSVTCNHRVSRISSDDTSGISSPRHRLYSASSTTTTATILTQTSSATTQAAAAPTKDKQALEVLLAIEERLKTNPTEYLNSRSELELHYKQLSLIMATSWNDMKVMVNAATFLILGIRRIKDALVEKDKNIQAAMAAIPSIDVPPAPPESLFSQAFKDLFPILRLSFFAA